MPRSQNKCPMCSNMKAVRQKTCSRECGIEMRRQRRLAREEAKRRAEELALRAEEFFLYEMPISC